MKKTLVVILALIFVLSIAGTAFAASNPFVDLPAKHWAYDAVSKLAAAGIVDGMGDGTFRGDKTMTRFEMAQIVAKAMVKADKADAANKALVDKLAVEFAKELNNLGVRVAKLEEKTKVALTYETRIRTGGNDADTKQGTAAWDFRHRIMLKGAVNDNVSYGARLEGTGAFGAGNSAVSFNLSFFDIKDFLGLDKVTVGKFGTTNFTNGLLNNQVSNNDGIAIRHKFGEVEMISHFSSNDTNSEVALFNFKFELDKNTKFNLAYQNANMTGNSASTIDVQSYDAGVIYKVGGLFLTGEYVSSKDKTHNTTPKAWAVQLTTGVHGNFFQNTGKIVNENKPHTDAITISYRNIDANAVKAMTGFSNNNMSTIKSGMKAYDNIKVFYIGYSNVVSDGIVWVVEFADAKDKVGTNKDKLWSTNLRFFY